MIQGPVEPVAPFVLDPEDRCLTWSLDPVHWPDPMTPLAFALVGDALATGKTRALRSYGRAVEIRVRHINGFRYQTMVRTGSTDQQRSTALVREAMADLAGQWERRWLPEIREHLAFWRAFDLAGCSMIELTRHFDDSLARMVRVWEIHFELLTPMHGAIRAFRTTYQDLLGGSASDGEALALLRGFDNRTLQMGRALWKLRDRIVADDTARDAFLTADVADVRERLARIPGGRVILHELNAFLDEHGQRRERLSLEYPSWREDPAPILRTLRMYVEQHDGSRPELAVVEREAVCVAVRERLGAYPAPMVAEFEFLLGAAQQATVLSEDHNSWIDACCLTAVRRVVLEVGRRLAGMGGIATADDVFLLNPEEIRQAACAGSIERDVVAARRELLERARSITPPATLGAGQEVQTAGTDPARLAGVGVSAGRVRGRARLLAGLEGRGGLKAGDVLVADAATPALAPLLGIVAGLVTESGSVLSHSAVVAREYGIPAVFGVRQATSWVREGQEIEVDGDRGRVRIVTGSEELLATP